MLRIFSALLRTICVPSISSPHSYTCNTYEQYFRFLDYFQKVIVGVSWDFSLFTPSLKIKSTECPQAPSRSIKMKKRANKKNLPRHSFRQVQRCRRVNMSFNSEYTKPKQMCQTWKTHTSAIKAWRSLFPSLLYTRLSSSLYLWPLLVLKDTCSILSPSR